MLVRGVVQSGATGPIGSPPLALTVRSPGS